MKFKAEFDLPGLGMATEKENGPFAAVDSGTLVVIDPCYLTELLDLTPEQEAKWNRYWPLKEDGDDVESFSGGGFTNGLVLRVGDDGYYSKERLAAFLLSRPT